MYSNLVKCDEIVLHLGLQLYENIAVSGQDACYGSYTADKSVFKLSEMLPLERKLRNDL